MSSHEISKSAHLPFGKCARFPAGMRSAAKQCGVWLAEILKFFKATPHKACAQIAPSGFSSDCTSSTPAGWRPPRRTCAIWRKICKQDACKARSAGFVRCCLKSMAYRQHNLKASKLRSSCKKSAEICVKRLMIKKFKNPLDKIKQMVYNVWVNKAESPHSHPPTNKRFSQARSFNVNKL